MSNRIVELGLVKDATDLVLSGKKDSETALVLSNKSGKKISVSMVKSFKNGMARNAAVVIRDGMSTVEQYTGDKFLDSISHVKRNIDELYSKREQWGNSPEVFIRLVGETRAWVELAVRMMGELKSVGTVIEKQQINIFNSPEFYAEFEKYLKLLHNTGKVTVIDRELRLRCGL